MATYSSRCSAVIAGLLLIFSSELFGSHELRAQDRLTVTPHRQDVQTITSRDYWFALPQNYEDQPQKSLRLYISSTVATTAYVQLPGSTARPFYIKPGITSVAQIPLSWEMKTSGIVEDKAIHVWSNDAALFVNFDSQNDYTSDASYVIPVIGWGREYVVASYNSLSAAGMTSAYDYPSEFVIVANQDSTIVTLTPSTDIRVSGGSSQILHAKHQRFIERLDRGQSVQYKVVNATDGDNFDLTGTEITSSKPIGLIGATQCANIPSDYPFCDFICEMIQPVRTWGKTYYTAPLVGRTGGDTYLMIGTHANQSITRTDASGAQHDAALLVNIHDHTFMHDVGVASKWQSDAPFLLVQYSNSATFPDNINRSHDPFMMAVNAVIHFSSPVVFNVLPLSNTSGSFIWHASVVAHTGDKVAIDGSLLKAAPVMDDGSFSVYQLGPLPPKQYTITAKNGVSVSIYGDGYDEAVGYAGMIGVSSTETMDIVPPIVKCTSSNNGITHICAADTAAGMSGLSHFEIDKLENMTLVQSASFVEGTGMDSSSFDLAVVDTPYAAEAIVRVVDLAGNYTTVTNSHPGKAVAPSGDVGLPGGSTSSDELLSKWLLTGTGELMCEAPTPNPSSSTAMIRYALRSDAQVTLSLYDLLGAKVLSLLGDNESTGVHTTTIDLRLLSSANYFYRIEAAGKVQSGKLTVAR